VLSSRANISVAAILVSFSLMVAMAIMVSSFRESLDEWVQRILPADHVEVGQRGAKAIDPGLGDALRQQGIPLRVLVALERRGVRHQHQLRARRGGLRQRLREPQVLADHQAHAHAIDLEYARPAIGVDIEIAALVEHGVVRQLALAVGGLDATVAQYAGGVVDHRAGRLRPADHGDDAAGGGGDSLQRGLAIGEERRPQQQVFRDRAMQLLCLAGLSGFPQITIPLGRIDGAPFGLSLLGPAGSDRSLIALAANMLAH